MQASIPNPQTHQRKWLRHSHPHQPHPRLRRGHHTMSPLPPFHHTRGWLSEDPRSCLPSTHRPLQHSIQALPLKEITAPSRTRQGNLQHQPRQNPQIKPHLILQSHQLPNTRRGVRCILPLPPSLNIPHEMDLHRGSRAQYPND